MGEDKKFVFNVGCPSFDLFKIAANNPISTSSLIYKYLVKIMLVGSTLILYKTLS
jgi:hypothetical protein